MRAVLITVVIGVIIASLFYFQKNAAIAMYLFGKDMKSGTVEAQSAEFVGGAVANIANGWNPDVYRQYADVTPETAPVVERAFVAYGRLGRLMQYPVCAMKDFAINANQQVAIADAGAMYTEAKYECQATFQNAPAVIQVTATMDGNNAWKIRAFNVVSDYFTRPPLPKP